jgi:hypothetical protein
MHCSEIRKALGGVAIIAACGLVAGSADAAFTLGDDQTNLKIAGLLQFQGSATEDAAPSGDAWDSEFYLRRMRLVFFGQLNPLVNYFVETDTPNFGKNGDFSGDTFIQDAFVELNVAPALQIDMGMLLLPFSHQGHQSAASMLTIDYHTDLINYPASSHKVWRDFGVMVRGMPVGPWLEYRLALTNGVRGTRFTYDAATGESVGDGRNPDDMPRLVARVVGNVFEPEGGPGAAGFFPDAVYLEKNENGIVSPKKVLAFGVSADYQPDAVVRLNAAGDAVSERSAYYALAADTNWDIPLGPARTMAVSGQINGYYYNHGDRQQAGTLLSTGVTGIGVAAEAGFRYQEIAPVVIFDAYRPTTNADTDHSGELTRVALGVNYFMYAHAFNLKAQFGATKRGAGTAEGDWTSSVLAQAQLFF